MKKSIVILFLIGYALTALLLLALERLMSGKLIVSTPIVVLWVLCGCFVLLLSNRLWPKRRKLFIAAVMVVCAGFWAYIGARVGMNEVHSKFTVDHWRSYPELRLYQTEDFLRKYGDSLQSRQNVIGYLGEPDGRNGEVWIRYGLDSTLMAGKLTDLDCSPSPTGDRWACRIVTYDF